MKKDEFIAGIGYAVARMVECDQVTTAKDIIEATGYNYTDFKAHCDTYDLPFIRRAIWGK